MTEQHERSEQRFFRGNRNRFQHRLRNTNPAWRIARNPENAGEDIGRGEGEKSSSAWLGSKSKEHPLPRIDR